MRRFAFLLLALLPAVRAGAQEVALPAPVMPRLGIVSAGVERPVKLEDLQLQVEAGEGEATLHYTLTLHNPNAVQAEGVIELPLLSGQVVSGFALEVDGELRDAVPVPKEKGRAVFEAIERRNVDPGLVEQTGSHHYRLRVYPVPARGSRRARISVSSQLQRQQGHWRLPLPLFLARDLPVLVLRAEGSRRLRLVADKREVADSAALKAGVSLTQTRLAEAMALEWRADASPAVWVQTHGGETFAVASFTPDATDSEPEHIPHLGLLWDASLSAAEQDQSLKIASLRVLLEKARTRKVSVVVLRHKPEAVREFDLGAGNEALLAFLQAQVADGASNPGGWDATLAPRWLYVGDGRFNYGQARLPQPPGVRIDSLADARSRPDDVRLAAWAAATGGRAVTLAGVGDVEAAALRLLQAGARIERIETLAAGEAVMASPWPDGNGQLRVAAKVLAPDARLRVHWRDARGLHVQDFSLNVPATPGQQVPRLWAQWQTRVLEADPVGNRHRLQRLGERFALVNAATSLIVLETAEDYWRHDITPPASLRAQVAALAAQREQQKAQTRQARLDRMAAAWAERIVWWEKDWPKDKPKAQPRPDDAGSREQLFEQVSVAMPQAAAPARMAMVAESATDAAAEQAAVPVQSASDWTSRIHVQPWQADSPISRRLYQAAASERYALYLDARQSHWRSPAFYLDAAEALKDAGEMELALRVLSNLAELEIEDRHLLRLLAYRLQDFAASADALPLLHRVRELADDEPQSHRDLGLLLARLGQHQAAADSLYQVVSGEWDDRFAEIGLIALNELNALIASHPAAIRTDAYDPRLLRNLPLGLRAVLSWDADNSDMDLWVTDPNGEVAYYGHRHTYQGGLMSRDFTGGYGPEEFSLRRPKPGIYKVEAKYFGDRHQVVSGQTSLQLWLSTGFATPTQVDKHVSLRLKERGDTVFVGEFEIVPTQSR